MPRKFLLLLPLILLNAVAFGQSGPDTCNKSNNETLFSVPSADQYASTIIATADGGYLLVGYSNAFGIGGFDGYVIKENSLGQVMWQKAYGGPGDDEFTQARQTSDGGYIL